MPSLFAVGEAVSYTLHHSNPSNIHPRSQHLLHREAETVLNMPATPELLSAATQFLRALCATSQLCSRESERVRRKRKRRKTNRMFRLCLAYPSFFPQQKKEKKNGKARNACADDRGIMLWVPPTVASSAHAPGPNMRRFEMTNGWGACFMHKRGWGAVVHCRSMFQKKKKKSNKKTCPLNAVPYEVMLKVKRTEIPCRRVVIGLWMLHRR